MTVKQLIEVLQMMDPDREVISTGKSGEKVKGVGTEIRRGTEVAVIR